MEAFTVGMCVFVHVCRCEFRVVVVEFVQIHWTCLTGLIVEKDQVKGGFSFDAVAGSLC